MRRIAKKKRIGTDKIRAKLEQAKECLKEACKNEIKINKNGETCGNCNTVMVLNDVGHVCPSCGSIGSLIEAMSASFSAATTQGYNGCGAYSASNGRCYSLNDNYNDMYITVLRRLTGKQQKAKEFPIPLEILRETARAYTELCQSIRSNSEDTENKRCNMVLPGILKQQLDKHPKMSRTDTYICEFMGINKGVLTKAKNKLQNLTKRGFLDYVPIHDRIASFSYQFLDRLNLDTIHTDVVVKIIRRSDVQIDMISYRTCQDNTKVAGTIWLLIRQLGIKMPHCTINKRLFAISKSTYVRYTDFLDCNRRKINPILVAHKIRPIPRSFAIKKKGRGSKKLAPLPDQYVDMFIQG
jgi:hypothetical protein